MAQEGTSKNLQKQSPKEKEFLIGVVDDHVDIVNNITGFLEMKGFRTVWAYNGNDAIKIAKEQKPDLLLLDIMMPGGPGGFEVAKELSEQKIIFMTADNDMNARAINTRGCIGVLQKPINLMELLTMLRKILKIKSPEFE